MKSPLYNGAAEVTLHSQGVRLCPTVFLDSGRQLDEA